MLSRAYRIDRVFGNSEHTALFCRQHGLPFELAEGFNESPKLVRSACSDGIGFSIDNALILKPRLLDSAGVSFFGVHSGILPVQRGNPVVAAIFAILEGSKEYGVSLFKLNAEIDGGEVLAIKRFAITPRSRLHAIVTICTSLGHAIFEEHLDQIVRGAFRAEPIAIADTRQYSLRDLAQLRDYRNHPDFDRATDFGVLDGLLPRDQLALIADLQGDSRRTAPLTVRSEGREQCLVYWKQKLRDVPNLQLPSCRMHSKAAGSGRKRLSLRIGEDLSGLVKAFAQTHRVPEFAVLLAAFYSLLARYTHVRDICVGSLARNTESPPPRTAEFSISRIVALRTELSSRSTCDQLIGQLVQAWDEARKYSNIPFEELRSALRPGGRLFDVSFQADSSTITQTSTMTRNVDQAWMLWQNAGHFDGFIEFDCALFEESMIARSVKHYENLLGGMLGHPDTSVFELEMVTAAERQVILEEWNATHVEYDNRHIPQLIEAQTQRNPDAVAIIGPGGERLSYIEVNARANRLARYIAAQEVRPEARVGICLERGVDLVVSLLAVMKAGGVFVPVDPMYPAARIAFMVEDAEIHLLMTQESLAGRFGSGRLRLLLLDSLILDSALQALPTENLATPVAPNHLAYIIYTSGSTGRPKGVMVEHGSVYNTLAASQRVRPMSPTDRFLSLASFGSDTAVWQLLGPLCWGACVVLNEHSADPTAILCSVDQHQITTIELVPSLLRAVLEEVDRGTRKALSLNTLISSGEALSSTLLEHAITSLPHCAIFNSYGPTESASQVTYHHCYPGRPVSIGVPLGNTRIYILSREAKLVPVGIIAEIVIGGVAVARGYLNQPELTGKKFVADPFTPEAGMRMYKTGDLGRYFENGEIEFVGRVDQQVKIRGHRVELGEIEDVLRRFPGVSDAIVLLAEERSVNPRLVAYVIGPVNGNGAGHSHTFLQRMRKHLRQRLPAHMVPAMIVPLRHWPMTAHGKIDRNALPDPSAMPGLVRSDYVAPRNEIEWKMAKIWASILGVDRVGMHDHFLELGGHSLLAVRLIAEVRAVFEVNLSLSSVFDLPTVDLMATFVSSGQTCNHRAKRPTRETLLEDAVLPPEIAAAEARVVANGDVLLTGSTGFVGRYLLLALLERTDARIHCLVRAPGHDLACRRIRAAMQLTDAKLAEDRLNVIVGDLTLPGLGLSSDVWSLLSNRVSAIYHLAAVVNHVASYDLLRATNVKGTLEVLRLATSGASKAVHFVSSLDIVDARVADNVLLCDEPPLHVEPYTSSKWVADQLVAKADARGIPACIYRTGYIGPHSGSGEANPSGWFELYLQAVLKIRSIPADANAFCWTPVDLIVDSICSLSRDWASLHKAFHLLDHEVTVSPATLVAAARRLGYALEVISGIAWRKRLAKYCAEHPDDPATVLGPYLDTLSPQVNENGSKRAPRKVTRAAANCARNFDLDAVTSLARFLRTAMRSVGIPTSCRGLSA